MKNVSIKALDHKITSSQANEVIAGMGSEEHAAISHQMIQRPTGELMPHSLAV